MAKIAINGFGRIGRLLMRIGIKRGDLDIVAVNNPTGVETLSHLLKYDSTYGIMDANISYEGKDWLIINGKRIRYTQERDPGNCKWRELGVDIVLESSGFFTDKESASKHVAAGAKKVIITAPGKNVDGTFVMGVNEGDYNPTSHHIISNASCTTNCLAPVAKILNDNLKINKGFMTTIHSYTNDQNILDLSHKDLRRARSAGMSIIPTTTGAASAISLVIPELKNKMNGISIRVPTPTVSMIDLVCEIEKETSVEKINNIFKEAAAGPMRHYLEYTDLPLVSVDFRGNEHSAIIDGLSTMVIDGKFIKIIAWYDNEWGYACRVLDLTKYIESK